MWSRVLRLEVAAVFGLLLTNSSLIDGTVLLNYESSVTEKRDQLIPSFTEAQADNYTNTQVGTRGRDTRTAFQHTAG